MAKWCGWSLLGGGVQTLAVAMALRGGWLAVHGTAEAGRTGVRDATVVVLLAGAATLVLLCCAVLFLRLRRIGAPTGTLWFPAFSLSLLLAALPFSVRLFEEKAIQERGETTECVIRDTWRSGDGRGRSSVTHLLDCPEGTARLKRSHALGEVGDRVEILIDPLRLVEPRWAVGRESSLALLGLGTVSAWVGGVATSVLALAARTAPARR